ncbi:MAG: hypothetical protein ACU0CB_05710, partial [Roseovarius sp.]
ERMIVGAFESELDHFRVHHIAADSYADRREFQAMLLIFQPERLRPGPRVTMINNQLKKSELTFLIV